MSDHTPAAARPGSSARASTRTTWTASRPAPSAIWCRQLVPSATTSVSASAARTAAAATAPPSASRRRSARPRSRSCRPSRSSTTRPTSTARPGTSPSTSAPPRSRRTPSGGNGRAGARAAAAAGEAAGAAGRRAARARGTRHEQRTLADSVCAHRAQSEREELVAQRQQARGSSPTIVAPRPTCEASASTMRRASRFASSTCPARARSRPQQAAGRRARHRRCARHRDAADPPPSAPRSPRARSPGSK